MNKNTDGNNIKLSIIIPVYNNKDYLHDCIVSVLNQKDSLEFEVIIIDDGSTDGSLQELRNWESIDSRIRVFSQTHSGPGVARNKGMQEARGKYITFLDADDFFCSGDALCKAYALAVERDCDVLACSAIEGEEVSRSYTSHYILCKQYLPPKETFNAKDLGEYAIITFGGVVWAKLYRNKFLEDNRLEFPNLPRSEDFCFVHLAICLANRISTLDEPLIFHHTNVHDSLENTKDLTPTIFWEASKLEMAAFKERNIWHNFKLSLKLDTTHRLDYNFNALKTVAGFDIIFSCAKEEIWPFIQSIDGEPDDARYKLEKEKFDNAFKYTTSSEYLYALNKDLKKEIEGYKWKIGYLEKQHSEQLSGWSWKIGRIITWLPRKLLGRK